MTDSPPASTPSAMTLTLIIAGAILLVACAVLAWLYSPEAWQYFDTAGLELREEALRFILFTGIPGFILLALGLPLRHFEKVGAV